LRTNVVTLENPLPLKRLLGDPPPSIASFFSTELHLPSREPNSDRVTKAHGIHSSPCLFSTSPRTLVKRVKYPSHIRSSSPPLRFNLHGLLNEVLLKFALLFFFQPLLPCIFKLFFPRACVLCSTYFCSRRAPPTSFSSRLVVKKNKYDPFFSLFALTEKYRSKNVYEDVGLDFPSTIPFFHHIWMMAVQSFVPSNIPSPLPKWHAFRFGLVGELPSLIVTAFGGLPLPRFKALTYFGIKLQSRPKSQHSPFPFPTLPDIAPKKLFLCIRTLPPRRATDNSEPLPHSLLLPLDFHFDASLIFHQSFRRVVLLHSRFNVSFSLRLLFKLGRTPPGVLFRCFLFTFLPFETAPPP